VTSASLCQQLSSKFSAASTFSEFFSEAEGKAIRNTFDPREQPVPGKPGKSCKTNLFFGFFFDGTKNNYIKAEAGKNHSNVARLYDCYPGLSVPGVLPTSTDWQHNPSRYTHFFKVYVPGVSSPFSQVHDTGEGKDETLGAAAGALGERRIIWALVQAINNVHRYLLKAPLVSQSEMDELFAKIYLNKHSLKRMTDDSWLYGALPGQDVNVLARRRFEALLKRLHAAVSQHWPNAKTGKPAKIDPGIVKTIYISVFGFSRGATEARAFLNWLQSLCKLDAQLRGKAGMSLGGFPVQFDFLGLFDTVASVGSANTVGFFNGHGVWADSEESLRVPDDVKSLHLVAAHELRRSFPVDSISVGGALPANAQEIVVPGVHSDIGCGYCPCEQGRGTDPNGNDMLARIPLLMMYKAARLNGVPLKLELAAPIAQARFALKPEAIKAFNAYIATCRETPGELHRIMREQARKQIEWRLARRVKGNTSIQKTASFARASTFDQNDLHSAAVEFEDEIKEFHAWLKRKGAGFRPVVQQRGFDNEHESEWEEIATWWNEKVRPADEVLAFFDNFVHDSRAWFKLNGPDSEEKMHAALKGLVEKRTRAQALNAQPIRKAALFGKADMSVTRFSDGLTDEERRIADEYARTGKIPRMMTSGREPFSVAKAGYLRFRKVYGGQDAVLLSSLEEQPADSGQSGADDNDVLHRA
jgi:hypothetical protein